mgnify:FL=1|jgi:hypothetical protein
MPGRMTEHLVNVDTCTVVQVSEAAIPFVEELLVRLGLAGAILVALISFCYVVSQYLLKD